MFVVMCSKASVNFSVSKLYMISFVFKDPHDGKLAIDANFGLRAIPCNISSLYITDEHQHDGLDMFARNAGARLRAFDILLQT